MFDLIIKNGRIVTAAEVLPAGLEIGIRNGKIAYIGLPLEDTGNAEVVDAQGAYITPGGIDSHVHIEQSDHPTGDTWETGSRSAIAGGNTTVLAFVSQKREDESVMPNLQKYHGKASGNAYCDYGFHLILTNPTKKILHEELKTCVEQEGISSVKLYMTYEPLQLSDGELLDVMMTTRELGMTTMVHAENNDMVKLIIKRLEERGRTDPFYHAIARPQLAENEATYRIISLAELVDTPILIVHMSAETAVKHVREAQSRLLPIHAETCPQYLFLRSEKLQAPDFEGSKWICSPPLRHDESDLDAMWQGLANGTFTTFSSDHCPDQFDHPCGKKKGLVDGKACFTSVPNGLPGVETRLPLLFSQAGEGPHAKISLPRFVQLTATNPAKLYGMDGQKGSLAPGYDADIIIWYPPGHQFSADSQAITIKQDMLHHKVDFTPFEGFQVNNWPRLVYLRGKLMWDRDNGGVVGGMDYGKFVKRGKSTIVNGKVGGNVPGMLKEERGWWM